MPTFRKCKTCGTEFIPKSDLNTFCSRKCFKKDYYHREKEKESGGKENPEFICPNCGLDITLNFDPVKDSFRWLNYACPGCNTLVIFVRDTVVMGDDVTT